MVDQALIDKLKGWRDNPPNPEDVDEKFGEEFLTTLFTIFKQVSEEDEDMKEEVEDADICMQFNMENEGQVFKFWISARGAIDFGIGDGPDVSVSMTASAENMFKMLSGEGDATAMYMSGDLTIEGNLQDAMAFGEIASLATEAIQDLME